jgi:SnoaL-like domain
MTIARGIALIVIALLLGSCGNPGADVASQRKAAAERYFRGIYECDSSVVDELAADSIVVSYPVFQTLLGKPALRGRQAVKDFSGHFCKRWIGGDATVYDVVYEDDSAVLMWSFRAKDGTSPTAEESAWGGITLIRFNTKGKIVAEVGEESTPGPAARLAADNSESG